ncbi:hypothetical protein, partial [Bartonella sp. AC53GZZY]|uniref:hypothetical protein n=1 Tax=Bartonella sp. AC53GZZY TaxID=3243456 RepID=UPI0035CF1CEA
IMGATHIDKGSRARSFLSGWSEWYLTESVYKGSRNSNVDCVDSCISSVALKDSIIRFFPSSGNGGNGRDRNANKYRTLRIGDGVGNGDGIVYSATGTSGIY